MYDLNQLEWTETPNAYETHYSVTLDNGIELAYSIDWDYNCTASMIARDDKGVADSNFTSDWTVLDELFGREHWQEFLAEKQDQALAELEKD